MDKITTILNCYRRPKNLEQQIDAIRSQGLSSSIWIWVNGHEDNKNIDFSKYKVDCVINSSINFKYHGRFTCGLLATTPYLAYFDDDTIPGSNWFESCLGPYRDWETDRKSTRLNSSHSAKSRMPSSA